MEKYPGCHGFLLSPAETGLQLGWSEAPPPRRAQVTVVDQIAPLRGKMLWRSDWPADGERETMWEEAWQDDSNRIRFISGHRPAVEVDADAGKITIETAPQGAFLYALAGSGLITLAQNDGALVLHACAAQLGDQATVVCAASGSGKSSLLLALAQAGWRTYSDDHCVIDQDAGGHSIWPGPEWMRLSSKDVPDGLERRFRLSWKDAWSLEAWQQHRPSRIGRLVVMDPPGGDAVEWRRMPPTEAVPRLSRHAVWLLAPADRGRMLFAKTVALAANVPTYHLRLPSSPNWTGQAAELLAGAV
jgi:hypothetical protein